MKDDALVGSVTGTPVGEDAERFYKDIFDEAPGALWMEDWSPVKSEIDRLAAAGVRDWSAWIKAHPDEVNEFYDLAIPLAISGEALRLYGASDSAEIFDMTRSDTVLKEQVDSFADTVLAFIRGDSRTTSTVADCRIDGESIMVRQSAVLLRGRRSNWGRVLYSFEDVTRQYWAEKEIREINQTLEQRIEERTAELYAAQHLLLRKERLAAMGQLTGMVAHEIRNPLGTISTSIHVIRTKAGEAGLDVQQSLERVDRNVRRCERIINELLDFGRTTGVNPRATDLDKWLSRTIEEHGVPDNIHVEKRLNLEGALIDFDPEILRRAIINVVDNACHAMNGGNGNSNGNGEAKGDQAHVMTVESRLNGERIEIEFTDSGPGIPEDILPQVLEPLFSTKSFGTGLGLPTVLQIMENHDGGLEIGGKEGSGARIVLWLPTVRVPK